MFGSFVRHTTNEPPPGFRRQTDELSDSDGWTGMQSIRYRVAEKLLPRCAWRNIILTTTAWTEVAMRGSDEVTGTLFSYVDLEERIPTGHPRRRIRPVVNDARRSLDGEFDRLYAVEGRPSIAPERLIRASLLQIVYSVRA